MNKTLSIIMFVLAGLFIAAALGNALMRSAAGVSQEFGVVIFLLVAGGLLIWGGISRWRK